MRIYDENNLDHRCSTTFSTSDKEISLNTHIFTSKTRFIGRQAHKKFPLSDEIFGMVFDAMTYNFRAVERELVWVEYIKIEIAQRNSLID